MVKNGRGQSGHGALKLTSDFAFWCKFRKAKVISMIFWVGVVKNGHGYLVHENLKSAVSKE